MTVHVISVGLSVLDSLASRSKLHGAVANAVRLEEPQSMLAKAGIRDGDRAKASSWLAGALAPAEAQGHVPRSAAMLAEVTCAIQPSLWPGDFSAERDTFTRMPGAGRTLAAEDIAVLVCSDTPDGLLAGVWNAAALAGGDLARVRYLADPASPLGLVRGCAVVARIRGMDAGDERGFREAMGGLGLLGRQLHTSREIPEREPFRFYLSGGFKAAIPYLIGLAEGLASLPKTGPVDAYVLHETAKWHESAEEPSPIALPLRRMEPDLIEAELRNLSEEPSRQRPPSNALEGYAYRKERNGWRLTAFGVGLKELFGIGPGLGT